jgi:hypothetical protein
VQDFVDEAEDLFLGGDICLEGVSLAAGGLDLLHHCSSSIGALQRRCESDSSNPIAEF